LFFRFSCKKSSKDIGNLNVKNNNEIMVPFNYNHNIDNRNLCVMPNKQPPSIIYGGPFDDNDNNNNKNYTKLEDRDILLNEFKTCPELEPKIDKCHMLTVTKETKQTRMTSNFFNNKRVLKAEICDNLIVDQTPDVRITRGKIIKLQREKRKQLDQKLLDKFPKNTFKKFNIKVYDIKKEVKFLRTLGLIYRFKCPFSKN